MLDGARVPVPPGLSAPGPIESSFILFLAFWILLFLVLLVVPRAWSDAVLRVAFTFLPLKPH
jgi:hypothetical protein